MSLLTHPGAEMAIFMLAIILGALFASKTKQSALVGQIVLGIIIGPALLDLVSYNEFVKQIAEIGIMILLFLVGLECKFKEVYTPKNTFIAIFSAALTWVFGYFIATLFGFNSTQSIFIGTAIISTSSAVVAVLLKETNNLKSDVGKIILGASAINDIIGLMIFSLVIRSTEVHMSLSAIIYRVFVAILYLVVFFIIGKKLSKYLRNLEYWGKMNNHPKLGFIFTLLIAFFFGAVSEVIGLSTMMGAFVAGLALEHIKDKNFKIGAEYLEIIFGSIFFVSLGILVENLFDPLKNIFLVIALLIAAILGKTIGGYIGARIGKSRLIKKNSIIIGFSLSPIGEIAALAALVALQEGIFNNEIYSSIIFVSIISSIIIPMGIMKMFGYSPESKKRFKLDIKHKRTSYL